jgi:hypothetical protein
MTEDKGSKQRELDRLADALVDDILNASPEEILAEFQEDHGGVERHVSEMRALMEKGITRANKRRLAAARAGAASSRASSKKQAERIDANEARRQLRTVTSEQNLTLAARKESEQSDEDLLSMIDDLRELGALPTNHNDDDNNGKP